MNDWISSLACDPAPYAAPAAGGMTMQERGA
jgi:hypothetical protein